MSEAEKKEAAKEPAKDGAAAAAPAPSKLKQLLPYVIGGVLSIGLGAGAAIVTAPKHVEPEVIQETEAPPPTPLDSFLPATKIMLEQMIVTVANGASSTAAQMTLILEVRAKDAIVQAALIAGCARGGEFSAPVRDALITLMSGKQASELKTPRGMELLKLEILDRLKPLLFADPANGAITGLYFHELLVQ